MKTHLKGQRILTGTADNVTITHRPACGNRHIEPTTDDTDKVTCGSCLKTLFGKKNFFMED